MKAGALAFSLIWAFQRRAATAPRGPAPSTIGMVRPMVRAMRCADSPASRASRRIWIWVTAASTQPEAPGNRPTCSSSRTMGTARAPNAARAMGMPSGTGTWAACQRGASSPSRPPRATTTMQAPADAAAWADSTVSSVSPENDTAKHRVPGPANPGGP